MKVEKPLLFQKPDFHPGVNVTVRKGAKWFGILDVGDMVEIQTTDGHEGQDSYGHHLVLGVSYSKYLEDVEPGLLRFEHDPACRTDHGIEAEMKRIYGDDFEDEGEGVTVVVFYFGMVPEAGMGL